MSRTQYKHVLKALQKELSAIEYNELNRIEKKRYRCFAKQNNLPVIWNVHEEKEIEYQSN